ncbi:MAG: serine/threonine protein kinase [Mycobacterium sp.]|nr:serine/threonine protein kinase [Mycobacterium sp.]
MSTVYRGLDARLDRPVALKVMDARYARDQQFLTRFQREARSIARLRHPGLVAIHDQGNDATHPFLVMELIEGGTLRELLRERGPMPPHAVAAVLRPVLGGLGVAHRAGLVHRDVKPENVLISDDGEVKLADFGLVRAIADAGITSTSVILGTAAYLSPEQVLGRSTGPRSDVYSAGVMAFELLTGRTPFTGDNPLAIANQRLDLDVPPPGSLIDGVPPQFDAFVAHATARDPEDRFPDASAMAAELDEIAADLGLPQFRVPAPHNSAQHTAATAYHPRGKDRGIPPAALPSGTPAKTRQFTPGTPAHQPGPAAEPAPAGPETPADEDPAPVRQFAGIDIDEFGWARQRGRRAVVLWTLAVLVLTAAVAGAAWNLGLNLDGLFGR